MRLRFSFLAFALAYALGSGSAAAQEAQVRAAVTATLAAWAAGDFQTFASYYHPDTRGFFLDGSELVEGVNVAGLQAGYDAGIRANLTLRDLDVAVYGNAAVSVGYLDGSLTLPGGAVRPGTWRYSETRVREGDTWRVVQFHFSELVRAPR